MFALVLLVPDTGQLIGAITAFTVAHSIPLGLAALGHLAIPRLTLRSLPFNLGVEAGHLVAMAGVLTVGSALRIPFEDVRMLPDALRIAATLTAGYAIGGVSTIRLAERLSGF